MRSPVGKAALDAMTDQSLAHARARRGAVDAELLEVAGKGTALLAEQFPGAQRETAGRAAMCLAHVVRAIGEDLRPDQRETTIVIADLLALVAEQTVREAVTRG